MTASYAVISGATGGIGSVVARACWAEGYSVLGVGRDDARLEAIQQWFQQHPCEGQSFHGVSLDLYAADVASWLQAHLHGKHVALLAICHGATAYTTPTDVGNTLLRSRWIMEVDVLGSLGLCQGAWDNMCQQGGGSITVVSSLHAHTTYPDRVPYAMAKSALTGMVRALALDGGPFGIRVNSILPWQVDGGRTAQIAATEGEDTIELYKQRSPLRRLVDPEDIARTVLWLVECPSMTGAEIVLDCGVSASMWHRSFLGGTREESE